MIDAELIFWIVAGIVGVCALCFMAVAAKRAESEYMPEGWKPREGRTGNGNS
jgi:hypothetical protein